MKIGITGAGGVIGTHLRSDLTLMPDVEIRSVFREAVHPLAASEEVLAGDLNDFDFCCRFLDGLDVVVHLAHSAVPLSQGLRLATDTSKNLTPTLNLLDATKQIGRKVHLVYLSSGGTVYGTSADRRPFTEDSPTLPLDTYGLQKLTLENFIRISALKGDISATILRVSTAYSHVRHSTGRQGFLRLALQSAIQGEPIKIIGNPQNIRDYIHVEDVCSAIRLSLHSRENYVVYNIGTGIGTSVAEAISLMSEILAQPVLTSQQDVPGAQNLVPWNVLDPAKAKAELGWAAQYNIRSGLRLLLDHLS